jgi:Flp pilus assembly protein TadG
MMRHLLRRLRRDAKGAAALDFALSASVLLLLVIGAVELGTVVWTWQALESTANDVARCAAVNVTTCGNVTSSTAEAVTYATGTAAPARGLNLGASNVAVSTGTSSACGTTSGTTEIVSVTLTYSFGAIFLVPLPGSVSASACFPLATG